ncbi:response regulator [Marinicrinis sediminis]|uniref:Response regulator n=1 Tax=Marinicrinis sediminis TaxID=1652465 RepID=A0ABW5RA90_9BACL
MWKVLIVEDEVFVRASIREIINWSEMGYELIGEAGTGREALDIIRAQQPHVVLTDIRMPEMDGLELVRVSRKEGHASKFIMLTSMGEFDDVRLAMEYGASHYILKLSMTVEHLRDTLQKMATELTESAAAGQSAAKPSWSYEQWWQESGQPGQLGGEDRIYSGISQTPGPYVYVCTVYAAPPESQWLSALQENLERQTSAVHLFRQQGFVFLYIWVHDVPDDDEEAVKRELAEHLKSIGIYTCTERIVPAELMKKSREGLQHLHDHWYGAEGTLAMGREEPEPDIAWELEKSFLTAFEAGDKQVCLNKLEQIWQEIAQMRLSIPHVVRIMERLETQCRRITRKTDAPTLYDQSLTGHEQTKQAMISFVRGQMTHHMPWQEYDHPEVMKIIRYIHQHYEENISVKAMAEKVNMDVNYVSGLFKRKTGLNLISYLHEVRISQARQLLIKTDMPIHQIGEKVGYVHDNYFNKIFKRVTNLTPNEYRRQHHPEIR